MTLPDQETDEAADASTIANGIANALLALVAALPQQMREDIAASLKASADEVPADDWEREVLQQKRALVAAMIETCEESVS